MTTADRVLGAAPDWKVTTGYRVLITVGWAAAALALYTATVAVVIGMSNAWWAAAGFAALALLAGVMMPAPVPRDLITGSRNRIDSRRDDG